MTYSTTRITARGYDVILPTSCVQAFFSLSHDDRVELADDLNMFDTDAEIAEKSDRADVLIEQLTVELEQQDQAIEEFMFERAGLIARDQAAEGYITSLRDERNAVIDTANSVHAMNGSLTAENDNMTETLVQTARYVGQLRELLAKTGISFETDDQRMPVLVINEDTLLDFVLEEMV